MGLKSPALDVPPEPPFKRQKTDAILAEQANRTASSSSPAPVVDLAERLDQEERQKYVKGKKLGSGQYADVFSAHLKSDPTQLVAIKKIKVGADSKLYGISHDSLREIRFLQELDHPNIIKLYAIFSTKSQNLNLVLEQLPQGDLEKLIRDTQNVSYTPADIKAWMLMLMRATWFCHANYVLHRDIKPNNLLIAANGEIKLADFGLARSMPDPGTQMTYNTITIWYRPPELFFQARMYSGKVDVWSCGCVFGELISRVVMFPAMPDTEMNMVKLICEKVGTPMEENWPGVSKLKGYVTPTEITPLRPRDFWNVHYRAIGDLGVDLLIKMLLLDPRKRLSSEEVLKHEFWTADPRPSRLEQLPKRGGGREEMADTLKQRGGEVPNGGGRGDGVARKIDFGALR